MRKSDRFPSTPARATALAVAVCGLLAPGIEARAEGGRAMKPVTEPTVLKECGACHMAFPAGMLPARSWQAIMAGLADHFGENASLDPAVAQQVEAYLTANAADQGKWKSPFMRRIPTTATPLRITETPYWISAHSEEVSAAAFKKAGSKANCVACHSAAAKGYFGDD